MKTRRKFLSGLFAICLATMFCAAPLWGAPKEKASVRVGFETSWRTDSNFYYADKNEFRVNTFRFKPTLKASYELPKSKVEGDFALSFYQYTDSDDVPKGQRDASAYDYVGGKAFIKLKSRPIDRLSIFIVEKYRRTRNSAYADQFDVIGDQREYWKNAIIPQISYDFTRRIYAYVRYLNSKFEYVDEGEDSTESRGTVGVGYRLTDTIATELYSSYWTEDYSSLSSDYDSYEVNGVVKKNFRTVFAIASIGYQKRSFDQSAMLDDIDTFIFLLRAKWRPVPNSDDTQAIFELKRNFNDRGVNNSYHVGTRVSLAGRYRLTPHIRVGVNLWYENLDFQHVYKTLPPQFTSDPGDRTYNLYHVSGVASYDFLRWLTAGLELGYEKRDTNNVDGFDFDNWFVMLKGGVHYDFFNQGRE